MNIRQTVLIVTLVLAQNIKVQAYYAHSIILDPGNDMQYRFFGSEGICWCQPQTQSHSYSSNCSCLENEIWFGYPQTVANFHFGIYNRLRFQEIDPKTGKITYCQAIPPLFGNGTSGNSNIRLQKGCNVRVWDPAGNYNEVPTWPHTASSTKPADWAYPIQ